MQNIVRIRLSIYPSTEIDSVALVSNVLGALEADPRFKPGEWDGGPRRETYNRQSVLAFIDQQSKLPPAIQLIRKKLAKYSGELDLGKFRFLTFDFAKSLPADAW